MHNLAVYTLHKIINNMLEQRWQQQVIILETINILLPTQ